MPQKFEIVLNCPTRQERVYYPGEEVSGVVIVQSDKPKRYRAVRVSLLGQAEVSWREDPPGYAGPGSSGNTGKEHNARDNFLHRSATVWTSGRNGVTQLSPGRHEFPFRFALSLNIPPTVIVGQGWVTYKLKATIETGALRDRHVEKFIKVSVPSNPITDIQLLKPAYKREYRRGCFLICRNKNTTVDISLPKRAYSIGEHLPLSVSVVAEHARRDRLLLTASLVQDVSLSVNDEDGCGVNILTSVRIRTERDTQSDSTRRILWTPEHLAVPTNALPSTRACRFVKISYRVFVVVTSRWRLGLSAEIPIEIGLPCDPSTNNTAELW